ncbi:MAG: hypothetical protein PHR57_01365 [Patescibacteria group bacterium]|nr:hypothetical protein [Patescibacteria group bacterium]
MADEREQISGKLREDRRSSNTIDQSLMNRSVSDTEKNIPEEEKEKSLPQSGEEYANLREQQAQSRMEKAGDAAGKIAGKAAAAYVGGGVQGKIVGKLAENVVKKQAKKKLKFWLIGAAASCLPGCLMVAGFLAMAAVMLTVLADPMKGLGLVLDEAWNALKKIAGAIAGFFTSS